MPPQLSAWVSLILAFHRDRLITVNLFYSNLWRTREIHECWGENSDYPKLDLRDKLTLDRFFGIGSFREQTVTAVPKICPDCQGQLFPGDQLDCPITGERLQNFECCSCNFSMSIALSDLETYPECY